MQLPTFSSLNLAPERAARQSRRNLNSLPASIIKEIILNRPIFGETGNLIGLLSIEENEQLLVGRWAGHCTSENIITGMQTALELLAVRPCRAVMSDGSVALGDWSDLVPWMQYDMLPRMVSTGVRYVANVRSTDLAGRMAHHEYARFAAQYLTIRLFDDPRAAREWLRQMLARERCPSHP